MLDSSRGLLAWISTLGEGSTLGNEQDRSLEELSKIALYVRVAKAEPRSISQDFREYKGPYLCLGLRDEH